MALPARKYTFVFSLGERGWTESWYNNTPPSSSVVEQAQLEQVASVRALMLGSEAKIKALRISNPNTTPDSLLTYKTFQNTVVQAPCASPNLAIYSQFLSQNVSRKAVYLRGFPDDVEVNGGQLDGIGAAVFATAFDSWQSLILTRLWGWYGVTDRRNGMSTTAVERPTGQVEFTSMNTVFTGVAVGTRVEVACSKFPVRYGLNGPHIVEVLSTTKCVTVNPIPAAPTPLQGVLKYNLKDFIQASLGRLMKVAPRKAGAPLLVTRGRRRAR